MTKDADYEKLFAEMEALARADGAQVSLTFSGYPRNMGWRLAMPKTKQAEHGTVEIASPAQAREALTQRVRELVTATTDERETLRERLHRLTGVTEES